MRCTANLQEAAPLARLVHNKTAGNPFFAIQFLSALAEEGLLTLDRAEERWSWDLPRIQAKGYTDNVIDLMVGKLHRLPVETQEALQQLACLGSRAEIETLSFVRGTSAAETRASLWEAIRQELVVRRDGSCKFAHDRIQEAAYSLIPEGTPRRSSSAHWPAAHRADTSGEAGRGDLRDRGAVQPRRRTDHVARRSGRSLPSSTWSPANGRKRRPLTPRRCLSCDRCRAAPGRLLGPPA